MREIFRTYGIMSALVLVCVAYALVRAPGIDLPYHQDEWKTVASVAEGTEAAGAFFAHPPLTQLILEIGVVSFGDMHMRLLPFVFGLCTLVLLFVVARRRADSVVAVVAVSLYAICAYAVLGTLMIDTDGAIIPFFFIAAIYAYDRWREGGWASTYWLAALLVVLMSGLLVKLSFIIAIGAIILDFLWSERGVMRARHFAIAGGITSVGAIIFACVVVAMDNLLPGFSADKMLQHAVKFIGLEGRNYTQIIIQTTKAVFYTSPLILAPLLLMRRVTVEKFSPFVFYTVLGAIFYLILFDFSNGALDKYLLYISLPLSVCAAAVYVRLVRSELVRTMQIAIGSLIGILPLAINFLPHTALPLYPKSAWYESVVHGDWNILVPFMGGSGPAGFYISFLFIGTSFFVAAACIALLRFRILPTFALTALIVSGLVYNLVFIEELTYGKIHGSLPTVLTAALQYIQDHDTGGVITHNDIGAFELTRMNKYAGRFYAVPEYEAGHRSLFASHNGTYLVVNLPLWNPQSMYEAYFSQCRVLSESISGSISARVYECAGAMP